ncbi:hypothetical protein V2J09_002516 [Rumex salicifolius]
MTATVAVAVANSGNGRGNGSRRAVRWAAENLIPQADRFILVHVMPNVTHIPTPAGDRVSIKELDPAIVTKYLKDVKIKCEEIFIQYKRIIKSDIVPVESLVLEDDNPATALLKYISKSHVRCLVLGSQSTNFFWRKIKGPGISSTVLKCSPDFCDIFIVSKHRVITKLAVSLISNANNTASGSNTPRISSSSLERRGRKTIGASSFSVAPSRSNSSASSRLGSLKNSFTEDFNPQKANNLSSSTTGPSYEQFDLNERINAAAEREEMLRKMAAEQKAKHLMAVKEAEEAKMLLAREAYERQIAELNALKESSEKQKIVDELISSDDSYRKYSIHEIEVATDNFSKSKIIGEGSYGKVYKGSLDHTPVAIKVLQQDASNKKEEFLKEIGILSKMRHPNIVLLLGACPENGCLVYEYMENGSLEELIFCHNGKPPIPWFIRFKIAFEIACGIAFLHSFKPEPIIHRDLKPGNILIGRNYLSKISDVGLAKISSEQVPDSVTHFGYSVLAGTLYYMDPEYQRTGTVRPKSDLYSFGVILLQLLTARHPNGLLLVMENAMESNSLQYMLDTAILDWPLAEAEEMAAIALQCCKLRCRDRPDLETQILPVLKRLADVADASMKVEKDTDGYTYERTAMEAWLEKHDESPVTDSKLQHFSLTPNKTLRLAIQKWRSRVANPNN